MVDPYELEKAEWQMVGEDDWVFGVRVRGLVRSTLAYFYFNEDINDERGGWVWCAPGTPPLTGQPPRGVAGCRAHAARACEEALENQKGEDGPC